LLAACPAVSQPQTSGCATVIIEQLVAPEGINVAQAEVALSRSTITQESANQLLQSLARIPPLQLQSAIDASLRCEDASIDLAMLEKLPNVPATKTLAVERLMASLGKRSDEHKNKWTIMLQTVMAPPDDIVQSLDAWLERLPKGDSVRGYQVFRSAKAACSSCHQVGYIGGRLGPELSRIGKTRTRRDLVEAVVFPSFRMSQGYYPVRIRTVDDAVFNGIFSKQTDSYVELLCGADKVCRIATEEIAEKSESKLSVMPTGLEQQMSLAEFADLIAFLESKK
jgi:putative heme-binding domain-containing protein